MEEKFIKLISNFIYALIKYDKLCRLDLKFAYDFFLSEEEYEKCSILLELMNIGYYNDDRKSELIKISTIIEKIEKFDNSDNEMKIYQKKIEKLTNELIFFIENIENIYDEIVIPPIKNQKNIKYFKK